MAYATTVELQARLGVTLYARLTDRVNGATASDAVGAELLAEAESELNSYLARRYATPIDLGARPELADVLSGAVLDIAEYRAWRGTPFAAGLPSRVTLLYEGVVQWLRAIAAGELNLPAAAPPAARVSEDDAPRYAASERIFRAEELDGL